MFQDLKAALRMIRARPGYVLLVLSTLALGIGANTAIFSVVNAVVLRPLPYPESERLYFVIPTNPKDGGRDRLARLAEFETLQGGLRTFRSLAVVTKVWEAVVTGRNGESSVMMGASASHQLLDVLKVRPALGRGFLPEEDVEGGARVAVLSHAGWQRLFGEDPDVIGKTLIIGGRATSVVGVLPKNAAFPDPSCELWLPVRQSAGARRWRLLSVVGRLNQGVGEAAARAELAAAAVRLQQQFPDVNTGLTLRLAGVQEEMTGQARPTLFLLLGAVGLVLLVACANVANLTLVNALSRRQELATRAALGATRGRLVRQLLTEGLVLGLAGGALGALLARFGLAFALTHSPVPVTSYRGVTLDARVAAFTLAISMLAAVAFSIIPAWRLLWREPQHTLRELARGAAGAPGHRRVSNTLVVFEVALALVLLVGAGLLTKTVSGLLALNPGFSTKNLLTMQVLPPPGQDRGVRLSVNTQLEEQLKRLPGVEGVGQISRLPLGTQENVLMSMEVQGQSTSPSQRPSIDVRYTTPDYFGTMRIPLARGRLFTVQDANVALINDTAAHRFWPNESPIGKQVRVAGSSDRPTEWHTIVGVVGSIRHLSLDVEPRPEVHFPAPVEQRVHLLVRTSSDPGRMLPMVRDTILQVDRRLVITKVETMDALLLRSMATRRFGMLLITAFAGLALVMAAIGIYGVMSYTVAQRRVEFGVRIALGAHPLNVFAMIVRRGMWLVLIGAAIGLAGALAFRRLLSAFLYGVSPFDPSTLMAVSALLALVAMLACSLAARRVTTVAPMTALRG